MKALKRDSQNRRPHSLKNRINHIKHVACLTLALLGIMTAGSTAGSYNQPTTTGDVIGDLNEFRFAHKSTLLSDGRVFIAGGLSIAEGFEFYTFSTEVYDPTSRQWSRSSFLEAGRALHTLTLLTNGSVLIVGGCAAFDEGNCPQNGAELYDPAAGRSSATGSLRIGRWGHTATLLPNGKVLVVGAGFATTVVELYDPASGTWSDSGSLIAPRNGHTATLLPDGKVLVAGGANGSFSDSAELYDPTTETWSATGNLVVARRSHTAALLQNGKVLVVGGTEDDNMLASAELYDPGTGTWSLTGNRIAGTRSHTMTVLAGGKVLVAGGADSTGKLKVAEVYDPQTETWSATGSLNVARSLHTSTLLADGNVLAAGGIGNGPKGFELVLNTAEIYDTATETWIGPVIPIITGTSVSGKKLRVTGENFDPGAVILLNGVEQKTKNNTQNPRTTLVAKNAGKKVKPGDRVQVLNPNGKISGEFIFAGLR